MKLEIKEFESGHGRQQVGRSGGGSNVRADLCTGGKRTQTGNGPTKVKECTSR